MIIFNKPNISPNIFGIILKKFYNLMNFICKKFLLTNFFYKSEVNLLELLVASVVGIGIDYSRSTGLLCLVD